MFIVLHEEGHTNTSIHELNFFETDKGALFKAPEHVTRRLEKPKLCSSARFQGLPPLEDALDGLTLYQVHLITSPRL